MEFIEFHFLKSIFQKSSAESQLKMVFGAFETFSQTLATRKTKWVDFILATINPKNNIKITYKKCI